MAILILLVLVVGIIFLFNSDKTEILDKIDGILLKETPCNLSQYKSSDVWNFTSPCCGSMLPTINSTDLVSAVKVYTSGDIAIRDIIVTDGGKGNYTMHRLVGIDDSVYPIRYETRGDNLGNRITKNPDGSTTEEAYPQDPLWFFSQIKYKAVCINMVEIE